MKVHYFLLALVAGETLTSLGAQESEADIEAWKASVLSQLDRRTGTIQLEGGVAELQLSDDFYFLDSEDSRLVLEEVWGNPPGGETMGMIFPAKYTPFDDASWAVTVDYVEDGYVKDSEAKKINYDTLLKDMQRDVREESRYRQEQGYESLELIGWAAEPYYDESAHKLHWAKELNFGEADYNTLNYNIRALGRKGYLVLNFIAGMSQLEEIDDALPAVLAAAEFREGYRYEEFDPQNDEIAAYGIGALVAGKAMAKLGLFAKIALALKKFWIVGLAVLVGIGKRIRGNRSEA